MRAPELALNTSLVFIRAQVCRVLYRLSYENRCVGFVQVVVQKQVSRVFTHLSTSSQKGFICPNSGGLWSSKG